MSWGIRSAPESKRSVQISVLERAPNSRTWLRRTFRGSVGCPTEPRASLPRAPLDELPDGCSSSERQTVAGAMSGDPSVDALGIHRAQAASREPASGADHAAIVDHRPAHRMGIVRSAPAPDGSRLVRRVSWAGLQLHRICAVSRQRSRRSVSPSIFDPAASRRFHNNT